MKRNTFVVMALFEGALGVVALALMSLTSIPINVWADVNLTDWLCGALLALATYALLVTALKLLPALHRQLTPHLRQLSVLFAPLSLWQLALISILAGAGEELLFRVFLQSWLSAALGPLLAVLVASGVFAALHWLSFTYFLLTLMMGLAFGVIYHLSQSFVLVASWHGIYDFIALVVVARQPHWLLPSARH